MYKETLFFTLHQPLKILLEDHDKADYGSPLYLKIQDEIITLCKDTIEMTIMEDINDKLLRSYKDQVEPALQPEQTMDGWFYTQWGTGVAINHGPFDSEIEAYESLLGDIV